MKQIKDANNVACPYCGKIIDKKDIEAERCQKCKTSLLVSDMDISFRKSITIKAK